MRLIDADYLTTEIARLVVGGKHAIEEAGHGNFWINGLHDVQKIIDNVPTIEAYTEEQIKELIKLNEEQVKELIELNKGEWINTSPYDDKGECSLCCYLSKKYYNFCPNCGSDMRGRRSDNE